MGTLNFQDMEVSAQELAIDGPSPKMEQFLKKNYNVERLLRQNNNFAVSPQFFGAVPEMKYVKNYNTQTYPNTKVHTHTHTHTTLFVFVYKQF